MAAPGETPKAVPIVTEHLLILGVNAKLEDKTATMQEATERAYVRSLNGADRAKLQANIVAWKARNDKENHAVAVVAMLDTLKGDIEAPDTGVQPRLGSQYLDYAASKTVEGAIGWTGTKAVEGLKKIPEYARDEVRRIAEADTMQEKIGIAGKNIGLLLLVGGGLYKLNQWISQSIDGDSKETTFWGGLAHLLKWTGILALTGWGANALLGKKASTAPTAAPTKEAERTKTTTTLNMSTVPEEQNLLADIDIDDAGKTEKRLEITVKGETVTILPPVNDAGKFEMRIVIGNTTYTVSPAPPTAPATTPGPLEQIVRNMLIDPHKATDGVGFNGRSALKALKNNVTLSKSGNSFHAEMQAVMIPKGTIYADIKINDLAELVRTVRDNVKTDTTEVKLSFAQSIAGMTSNESKIFIVKKAI